MPVRVFELVKNTHINLHQSEVSTDGASDNNSQNGQTNKDHDFLLQIETHKIWLFN